jgi:hypothetical protein
MSLRLELLERIPVPPLSDEVRVVGHQLLEAVQLAEVERVSVSQPHTNQVD